MRKKKTNKQTKKSSKIKGPIDKLSKRKAYVVSFTRSGKRIRSRAIFRSKKEAGAFAKRIEDGKKKNIRVVNANVGERVLLQYNEEIEKAAGYKR